MSPDGLERTLAINHLAVAALTAELLGLLRAGAKNDGRSARVVNLSSTAEQRGRAVTDWTYPFGYRQLQAYADSKLVNLAYTYTLAGQLAGDGVTVNAANPGSVATGFGTKAGGRLKITMAAGKIVLASPAKGARTSVRLAADPELDGATGGYYSGAAPDTSSAQSRDVAFGRHAYTHTQALLEQSRT